MQSLNLEREARKVGSQAVSFILTGNGAVVFDGTPSSELSFLCLLADEKRPVFFAWQPRPNAPALAQCTRSEGLRSKAAGCLELLLRVAEQDLAQVVRLPLPGGERARRKQPRLVPKSE